MVNSCLYQISCLGVSETSNSANLDGKQLLYQISCLGGPETSKSVILDGKQLFVSNQVFKSFRDLKIGYFRW